MVHTPCPLRKLFIPGLLAVFLSGGAVTSALALDVDTESPFLDSSLSKRISMDFQNAPLVQVLKIFSQQTSLNLITSESLSDRRVTVYLENVPVMEALDQLLKANNLTYEVQPGSDIYIVKPLTRPNEELITRVYTLKNASVPSAKYNKTLRIKDDDDQELFETSGEGEAASILNIIQAILTDQGKVEEDPRTNSLIITDIAQNFPHIEATIAKLDVPVPLILIEVEMLEVTKEVADKMGLKIGDTPAVFSGAIRNHAYPFNQNMLLREGRFGFTDFQGAFPEFRAGSLDFSGLEGTLQMLRTHTDTKSLARPRILTLNNEPAQIRISTDEAIGLASESTNTGEAGTTTQEAERVKTGVFLTVTPQANTETGEITLAIAPKVIIARTGATFSGITFLDPEERGTMSRLRVQSGDTIVIGGLIREDETRTKTKVPFLGDIPLLGNAFRHKDSKKTQRELIVFITPHIVEETPFPKAAAQTVSAVFREQTPPGDILSSAEPRFPSDHPASSQP